MDRSQLVGALVMAGAVLDMLVFAYGMARRSYLAVALPVMAALTAVSALAFWIGWTMATSASEIKEGEFEETPSV